MDNKREVVTKDEKGQEIKLIVKRPNGENIKKAKIHQSNVFTDAITNNVLSRDRLLEYLKEQSIWDDDKEKKVVELSNAIRALEKQLPKLTKTSLIRDKCLELSNLRSKQLEALAARRRHDEFTAEAQAENSYFDFLVSECTLNEKGDRVFKDLDDYYARANEQVAADAATELSNLLYGLNKDWQSSLPEFKFLKKHGLIDDLGRLVNKKGDFVTKDWQKVNDKGQLINDDGHPVDIDGNLVDDDGNIIVEEVEVEDDLPV
jgi:hypothetical protein